MRRTTLQVSGEPKPGTTPTKRGRPWRWESTATPLSSRHHAPPTKAGFTRLDLLGALLALALVLGVVLPGMAATVPGNGRTQCLSNLRRLMLASQLYARDNRDYLPHPTWGSDFSGPDGWAYATANNQRLPGAPARPPSLNREGQKPWRTIGQLWPYVKEGAAYECPDDLIIQNPDALQFRQRTVQIASYQMNGMVAGYPINGGDLSYPITRFLPNDLVLFECSEREPFFFNDAGVNPSGGETITMRHGGGTEATAEVRGPELRDRGGNCGRIDGGAEFISRGEFTLEASAPLGTGPRNRILCYPTK